MDAFKHVPYMKDPSVLSYLHKSLEKTLNADTNYKMSPSARFAYSFLKDAFAKEKQDAEEGTNKSSLASKLAVRGAFPFMYGYTHDPSRTFAPKWKQGYSSDSDYKQRFKEIYNKKMLNASTGDNVISRLAGGIGSIITSNTSGLPGLLSGAALKYMTPYAWYLIKNSLVKRSAKKKAEAERKRMIDSMYLRRIGGY